MQIFHATDTGYDDELSGFQTGLKHAPQVIFAVENADDVREAVDHADQHGLTYDVQATGHGITTPTDGVLISTKRMNRVHIDPETRTARVEAGAVWRQVIDAAAPHGLAPLSGDSGTVGVVGYTLAGGYPLLGREFGFANRRVTKIEKTADVVTALEFELVELDEVHLAELWFAAEHGEAVFEAFHKWDVPQHVTPWITTLGDVIRVSAASTGPFEVDHLRVAPTSKDRFHVKQFGEALTHELPPHTYQGDNVLVSDLSLQDLHDLRERAAERDVFLSVGLTLEDASHVIKVVSPRLGAERVMAEVFDAVRPQVVGRGQNFVFAVHR